MLLMKSTHRFIATNVDRLGYIYIYIYIERERERERETARERERMELCCVIFLVMSFFLVFY
jgi:hypothetical protein